MNVQPSQTVKGKDRYKAGVMEYKKMGYLGARLRAERHRHHRLLPRDAAGRGRSD